MIDPDIPHPDLLSDILAFCAKRGMKRSAFGLEAIKDRSLVTQIEAGRELRRKTVNRIREYIDQSEAGAAE
jgi:hypothetical protein